MAASLEADVVMAADGRGSFVFPDFQPSIDGFIAIAKLLEFLAKQKRELSDVIAALPAYYIAETEVYCIWEAKGRIMRKLRQQFEGQITESVEGIKIRINGRDWVLMLASQDQPYIRVIAEAASHSQANKHVQNYAKLVRELQPEIM